MEQPPHISFEQIEEEAHRLYKELIGPVLILALGSLWYIDAGTQSVSSTALFVGLAAFTCDKACRLNRHYRQHEL